MSKRQETPEQVEFREHCRAWLKENKPEPPTFRLPSHAIEVMTDEQAEYLQEWQAKCYAAGLIGCDYPKEVGGGGHKGFQRIANQEMNRARGPFLINAIGLGMAAPTIFHHATDEVKRAVLPKLFEGSEIWCQGFSEPGSGSDLASCQAKVTRDGEDWRLNGHKVWTSLAKFASWMIVLVRHSSDDKYRGLSYFIVPIAGHEGVTVRPLIKMTGETGFNEVLFDDAKVLDAHRLGELGDGWKVAMTTLLHERGAGPLVTPQGGVGGEGHQIDSHALMRLAKTMMRNGKPAIEDPIIREKIADIAIREAALRASQRRARVPGLLDHPMRIPLQMKLVLTELMQDCAALGLEIGGAHSSLFIADDKAPDAGQWPLVHMGSFGMTIAAGTSEIQRNILGERVLGLAKSK